MTPPEPQNAPLQRKRLTLCPPLPSDFGDDAMFHADPQSTAVGAHLTRPTAWQRFAAMPGSGFGMYIGQLRHTGRALGMARKPGAILDAKMAAPFDAAPIRNHATGAL
ncbi:hypothetical protein [Actibacterium sp. 188UL27-1]|uniref:hypothetical protein n=1 Tax=Actibacterium sp. 188UL27-1 TaxID=2786961 RepID=UPI00195639D9|nr:hypothetical protein [Actibacterium sp. 188UL27-1]MBM7066245.1 hypothetical protein [Actibacterium sp. 188UL27-1]